MRCARGTFRERRSRVSIVDKSGDWAGKPYAFASPRNRHEVVITKECVSVLSCEKKLHLRSIGDCGLGCCDDYECPDCGKRFRVEWPD